ncbi:hypothetical protein U9M48_011355 [Paspalum notatum var. saurae]|uniref:DUF3615 domain-containing protein n=1 Tax=Paspalum notatum var. saurae TaxID=547442 RepID=A0AAQ3SVF7_PASNO
MEQRDSRAPEIKDPHFILRPDPKVMLAQAKRFATGVLEHYNKNKENKFELLDAKPVISIPEARTCYTHINFTARSSKEDSEEQLFFAEIKYCVPKGRLQMASSLLAVSHWAVIPEWEGFRDDDDCHDSDLVCHGMRSQGWLILPKVNDEDADDSS